MTVKQNLGSQAPDGSMYVTLSDGAGNLGGLSVGGDVEIGAVEIKNATTEDRVLVSPTGSLSVSTEGTKATYTAVTAVNPAAGATNFLTIGGSASKTVRVQSLRLYGVATSDGNYQVVMRRQSTADTGGTAVNLITASTGKHDSNNAAPTATAVVYTANPTQGTLAGFIGSGFIYFPATTNPASGVIPFIREFRENTQACVLRGTSEQMAVTLSGQTIAGATINIEVTWTEE